MPPSSAGRAAALEALASLKTSVPGVKLRKNEGEGDDADIFPVEVRVPIASSQLPAAAGAFDVPPAWLLASVAASRDDEESGSNAPSVSVSSFECEGLPRKVLDRATAGLRAAFASSPNASSTSIPLAALPAAAGAAFFAAVQSLAEIEPYETVDASGASSRRFAVVREDVEMVVEEVPPARAAPRAAATLPPKPLSSRAPFLPSKSASSSPAEAEMRFLERRFGSSLSILDEAKEGEQDRRRRRFRVSNFVPSDPAWRSGPVSLLGTIDFQRYPAPGSFALFAEVEEVEDEEGEGRRGGGGGGSGSVSAARLTLALRRAAATASSSAAAASDVGGGQGDQQILRSLVRLADSRGGELSAAPAFALSDDDDETESDADGDETESDDDDGSSSSSRDSSGDSSGSSSTESESESEDETAAAAALASNAAASSSSGGGARFALSLSSLSLDGVEALSPAALSLELSCLRCSSTVLPPALRASDAGGSSSSSPLQGCETCRAPLSLSLQPRVAHASSSVVAVVRCSGCVPKSLLLPLSSFGAQCERCSRVAALRGAGAAAASGVPSSPFGGGGGGGGGGASSSWALRRQCPSCHASLAVLFEECSFDKMAEAGRGLGRGNGGGGGGTGARRKKKGAPGSGDGGGGGGGEKASRSKETPLPRNGACDHYPHSHRAMRFPCCFRVHSCDVCHELSAASDSTHPPEVASVATRMVCGFCSKEQPFEKGGEAAVCRRCGRRLAGSARHGTHGSGTRHWEGGKGCRDPRRLDRRDSKKHKGSKLKTRSRKASRVGAEAAAKKKKKQRGEKKKE